MGFLFCRRSCLQRVLKSDRGEHFLSAFPFRSPKFHSFRGERSWFAPMMEKDRTNKISVQRQKIFLIMRAWARIPDFQTLSFGNQRKLTGAPPIQTLRQLHRFPTTNSCGNCTFIKSNLRCRTKICVKNKQISKLCATNIGISMSLLRSDT